MAVYQSQLGNVIRVLDIDEDSVIATAAEMGSVRAFIFNQTTDNINVTFPNPVPLSEKIFTVVNRGNVVLRVQNVAIEPGPAYGFFWDGAAYRPTMVDGVGMVSNLEESPTIKFRGNGEELTPLAADVKISPAASNVLEERQDGLYVAPSSTNLGLGKIWWVDASVGDDDVGDGSLSKPYKSFTKAMSIASNTGEDAIVILPGDYEEDFSVIRNVNIEGLVEGNKVVRFLGEGSNFAGIHDISIKNIAIHVDAATPAFSVTGFGEGVVFSNVKLTNTDPSTSVLLVAGNNQGTLRFSDSEIIGKIEITDNVQDDPHRLWIENVSGITGLSLNSTRSTVIVQNVDELGFITHIKGNLYIQNVNRIIPEVNGRAIISSALFNDGFLGLKGVNLRQLDGSFAAIDKSGDCNYYFDDVSRSIANLGFSIAGSKLLSTQAADINAGITVSNYTPVGPSIAGHLAGIDAELLNKIESVEVSDTSTIQTFGTGTTADPFQPFLKISTDPKNTIEIDDEGVLVKSSSEISKGVTYFVDHVTGDDTGNDGTFGAPFKTINKAMSVVNSFDLIKIFPGDYVEDITINSAQFVGVLFEGFGLTDAAQVRVLGQILLDTVAVSRSRFKDIAFVGVTSGIPTVTIRNTSGRFKWENVSISHEDGSNETVVEFAGDNLNWFEFNRCGIDGKFKQESSAQQGSVTINIIEPYAAPEISLNCTPAVLVVRDAGVIKAPVHTKGTLFLDGVSRVVAVGGVSLTSTSMASQGMLGLKNVSFFQENGTFGLINKTGDCPYLLAGVVRDRDNDVLTGTAVLKTHAEDYHGNYEPVNYDIVGENIPSHLAGIDKKVSRYVEAILNYHGGWADAEVLLEWPITQPFSIPALLAETVVKTTNLEAGINSSILLQKRNPANVISPVGRIYFNNGVVTLTGSGASFAEDDTLLLVTENGAVFGRIAINLMAEKD